MAKNKPTFEVLPATPAGPGHTRLEPAAPVPPRTPTAREAGVPRSATVLEAIAAVAPVAPQPDAVRFRPTLRPPLALLCVLDDGSDEGDWVRLRGSPFVLGRTEGHLTIPHDNQMSGKHAELSRQWQVDRWRWVLADLNSTNGTFVRVTNTVLNPGQEILVGGRRFRFQAGTPPAPPAAAAAEGPEGVTRGWQVAAPTLQVASLVEVLPQGDGPTQLLGQNEAWIGRDGQCLISRPEDPLMSPRHARLYRDGQGTWHVENASAVNGTWLRVTAVPLESSAQFQLGEQRFLVKVV